MTKSTTWLSLAALLIVSGTAQAAAVNLVTNGSFEQGTLGIGSFQNWQAALGDPSTFVDSSGLTGPNYGEASDGLWAAYFGSTFADGGASISQMLATTASETYILTFDLASDNGGLTPSNGFAVSVANLPVFSFTNVADRGYVHEYYVFTASSNATLLNLFGYNDQSYMELDNVAVSAAPEPSAVALLLAGVLAISFVTRALRLN